MAFSKETFGTLENGAVITKYTLTNKHGLKASFTDLGGIWLEMWVPDKHGTLADVVLGYDEPEKYLHQDAHFGEIVGRNANRISNATCTIDGITYALVINDNGINNLHSGPDFFRDRSRNKNHLFPVQPGWRSELSGQRGYPCQLYSDRG